MKTNPYIIDYYNNYDEDSRLSPRHGTVEFLTTMRYIEKYIKPGSRVLEIGAGTGRYSHALARLGYTVDAVELVPHNIEVFCRHTLPAEHITITQGNALDLSAFSDNQYDITLLLGPLYHLYTKKRQAPGAGRGHPRHKTGRHHLCSICHIRRLSSGRRIQPRQYQCSRIHKKRPAGPRNIRRQIRAQRSV